MSSPTAGDRGRGDAPRGRGRGDHYPRNRGDRPRGPGRGRGCDDHAIRGRGRGRGSGIRGRGRGADVTGRGGEGDLSLREHADSSIIPLHLRHRIYLPLDNPRSQVTDPSSSQSSRGAQGPSDKTPRSTSTEESNQTGSYVVLEGNEQSHVWMRPQGYVPRAAPHRGRDRRKTTADRQENSTPTTEEGEEEIVSTAHEDVVDDKKPASKAVTTSALDPLADVEMDQGLQDIPDSDLCDRPEYIQRFKKPSSETPATQSKEASATEERSDTPSRVYQPQDPDDLIIFDDSPESMEEDLIDFEEEWLA
ncbi:MAG: hypothetical protein Q9225_007841 [Loekoesia sp. 1 TL-2023]